MTRPELFDVAAAVGIPLLLELVDAAVDMQLLLALVDAQVLVDTAVGMQPQLALVDTVAAVVYMQQLLALVAAAVGMQLLLALVDTGAAVVYMQPLLALVAAAVGMQLLLALVDAQATPRCDYGPVVAAVEHRCHVGDVDVLLSTDCAAVLPHAAGTALGAVDLALWAYAAVCMVTLTVRTCPEEACR